MAEKKIEFDADHNEFICRGDWDISHLPKLSALLTRLPSPQNTEIKINGAAIKKFDSSAAWFLSEWKNKLEDQGNTVHFVKFSTAAQDLLRLVSTNVEKIEKLPVQKHLSAVTDIGLNAVIQYNEFLDYLAFIGIVTYDFFRIMTQSTRSRIVAYASVIYHSGYLALVIIALLSFMIGVVIAYQLAMQLKNYGAQGFMIDFLGISLLREFGPLITAIMVAGRTGSAFTAQIGMMRLNQEIDALNTMGVTPSEVLIIPRIVGLFIVLPLLTMWADIWSVTGGMLMTSYMTDISTFDFLQRFPAAVPIKNFYIGLGKTPTFALIISTIGCYMGMRVQGGAASLGKNTTRSVVLSIFFILVADALFSIIFSKLKL